MLRLNFSTNLIEKSNTNYAGTLEKIRKEMGKWKYRHLTHFGRITLIKTIFISKLTHLLMSLPTLASILQEVINLMFRGCFFFGILSQIKLKETLYVETI